MKEMHPILESLILMKRWLKAMEESGQADEAWKRIRVWEEMIEKPVMKVEKQDHVGVITLNYPEKGNAIVPN